MLSVCVAYKKLTLHEKTLSLIEGMYYMHNVQLFFCGWVAFHIIWEWNQKWLLTNYIPKNSFYFLFFALQLLQTVKFLSDKADTNIFLFPIINLCSAIFVKWVFVTFFTGNISTYYLWYTFSEGQHICKKIHDESSIHSTNFFKLKKEVTEDRI